MVVRTYFNFSYFLGNGRPKLNKRRDGDAFSELCPILNAANCEYGDILLNGPPPEQLQRPHGKDNLIQDLLPKTFRINHSFLRPSDILVLPTRPPLDDENKRDKKMIWRSHTDLEEKVLKTVRPIFEVSTRSNIRLSEKLAKQLKSGYETRADISFRQNLDPFYKAYREYGSLKWVKPEPPPRTAAYLVIPRKRSERHPQILCSFGMGGTETLIWAYLLRKRYWRELELDLNSPRFVMVEIFPEEIRPYPLTLSFADNWQVDVLLNVPL